MELNKEKMYLNDGFGAPHIGWKSVAGTLPLNKSA